MADSIRRLDRVVLFGGKLSFHIPHEWIEAESEGEDTYLYQEPGTTSCWFRVSLLTTPNVPNPKEKLRLLFSDGAFEEDNETGNFFEYTEENTSEHGVPLRVHQWVVANVPAPDRIAHAVFSYTVLANETSSTTSTEVELLHRLVTKAKFDCPKRS